MSNFGERLTELMFYRKISPEELAKSINVNQSTIRDWKRSKYLVFLDNLVKLANFFGCSIDFLIGRSDTLIDFTPQERPPFFQRLREVMAELGVTRYKLVKKTGIQDTAFSQWKKGANPHVLTLIKLANYLDVTIDYLIGRDRK